MTIIALDSCNLFFRGNLGIDLVLDTKRSVTTVEA